MKKNIRTRVGPSPTGDPHVGTAYIALFNYAFVKKYNGQLIIRIEDTDQIRSSKMSELNILKYLKWLKLDWNEGPDKGGKFPPYRQSLRTNIYTYYAQNMVDNGFAYWCSCSQERLKSLRFQQKANGISPMYDKYCLNKNKKTVVQEILRSNSNGVIRLNIPKDQQTEFYDIIRGKITIKNITIDDQVLIKQDGFPTYHLANVIDDHLMNITHVIRGDEWINSTAKHIIIYNALGLDIPYFCHLPLLRMPDNSKISKRNNVSSLEYYKRNGILPESLNNFLGLFAFPLQSNKELFSIDEFIHNFSLQNISLGSPIFNLTKLMWLNGRYIREKVSEEYITKYIVNNFFSVTYLKKIIPLVRDRIEKYDDFFSYSEFFFRIDVKVKNYHSYLIETATTSETVSIYTNLIVELSSLDVFSSRNIESAFINVSEKHNIQKKYLLISIRLAVTAASQAPPLFLTMSILGKNICSHRIRKVLDILKSNVNK